MEAILKNLSIFFFVVVVVVVFLLRPSKKISYAVIERSSPKIGLKDAIVKEKF